MNKKLLLLLSLMSLGLMASSEGGGSASAARVGGGAAACRIKRDYSFMVIGPDVSVKVTVNNKTDDHGRVYLRDFISRECIRDGRVMLGDYMTIYDERDRDSSNLFGLTFMVSECGDSVIVSRTKGLLHKQDLIKTICILRLNPKLGQIEDGVPVQSHGWIEFGAERTVSCLCVPMSEEDKAVYKGV